MGIICSFDGCTRNARGRLWQGKPYCNEHYSELMTNDFETEWSSWKENTHPSKRLLYLCGRFLDEGIWVEKKGSISNARLRDRGINFQKSDTGFTFEITRHLNAFRSKNPLEIRLIVQKWKVLLQDKTVELIEERAWTEDDPV